MKFLVDIRIPTPSRHTIFLLDGVVTFPGVFDLRFTECLGEKNFSIAAAIVVLVAKSFHEFLRKGLTVGCQLVGADGGIPPEFWDASLVQGLTHRLAVAGIEHHE